MDPRTRVQVDAAREALEDARSEVVEGFERMGVASMDRALRWLRAALGADDETEDEGCQRSE